MSASISIRPGPAVAPTTPYTPTEKAAVSSSSFSSGFSRSPQTPTTPATPTAEKSKKPKHERRPSLLSPAIARQECTVIDIGDPDSEGPTRLISYLSSGQGFTWNPEIFIPSYIDCDYVPLENRREPVHEIYLSDEEAKNMLPK